MDQQEGKGTPVDPRVRAVPTGFYLVLKFLREQMVKAEFASSAEEQRQQHDEIRDSPFHAAVRNDEIAGFGQPVVVAMFA